MLNLLWTTIGFAGGFAAGIAYGTCRSEPWKDLSKTVSELTIWVRRVAQNGPKAPQPGAANVSGDGGEVPSST